MGIEGKLKLKGTELSTERRRRKGNVSRERIDTGTRCKCKI